MAPTGGHVNSSSVQMWWFEQGADWQKLPSLQTQVLQRSQECMKLFVFFFANLLTFGHGKGDVSICDGPFPSRQVFTA